MQRGVALAIVLWFLAGMSLLVSGITYLARTDTQMAQLHLARATAVSAGDGAILLMLAGFAGDDASRTPRKRTLARDFMVGTQTVSVVMVPATRLIDLNAAPASVLAGLFVAAAHMPRAEAKSLAENMVLWRNPLNPDQSAGAGARYYAPEDMLRVPGVTRAVWDGVRDSVVVTAGGNSDAAPGFVTAPDAVEAILETADVTTATGTAGSPATEGIDRGAGGRSWRVDALVSTGGRTWLRRKWVLLGSGGDSPLPWRFSRVEAPRVVGGERVGR